jgi:hypothetical protein
MSRWYLSTLLLTVATFVTAGDAQEAASPGVSDFTMAALPEQAHGRGLDTLLYFSFDDALDADAGLSRTRS